MTTPTNKELCDALVEDGILERRGVNYLIPGTGTGKHNPEQWCGADSIVSMWAVAGACLECIKRKSVEQWYQFCKRMMHMVHDNHLPRAIITTYVESLDGDRQNG